jgi:hypothetical protein
MDYHMVSLGFSSTSMFTDRPLSATAPGVGAFRPGADFLPDIENALFMFPHRRNRDRKAKFVGIVGKLRNAIVDSTVERRARAFACQSTDNLAISLIFCDK